MTWTSYTSMPGSDQWSQIDAAMRGVDLASPAWLWAQHNEHRMVFTKIFCLIDLKFFRGRQIFLLSLIFLVQFLELFLLAWSLQRFGRLRGAAWTAGVGLIAFCLFCPSQWENLIWGFQVHSGLLMLFATLSITAVLLMRQAALQRQWKYLAFALLMALAANYTMVNGILLWPLLIVAGLVLGIRPRALWMIAGVALLNALAYFHGYHRPGQNGNPFDSLRTPGRVVSYFLTFLGSSWSQENIRVAIVAGALGFAGAVLTALLLWKLRKISSAFSVQMLFLMLFALGTAAITALGRIGFGLDQAFSPRYQAVALMFWLPLGLLLLYWAVESGRSIAQLCVQAAILASLLWAATLVRFPLRTARWYAFQINAAGLAMVAGAQDDVQFRRAAVDPEVALQEAAYLREHSVSIFAGEQAHRLGKPFDSLFRVAPSGRCDGSIESEVPVGDGKVLRLSGWVWDKDSKDVPRDVIAVQNGIVTGVGIAGDWRPDVRTRFAQVKSNNAGLTGYARTDDGSPIRIYALTRNNPVTACYFAEIKPAEIR